VEHAVDHRGVAGGLGHGGHLALEVEGAGVGDEVVGLAGGVLEGELDVVEPGVLEAARRASVRPTPEVMRLV
jgi:hypothetical protein